MVPFECPRVRNLLVSLPLAFVESKGARASQIRFVSRDSQPEKGGSVSWLSILAFCTALNKTNYSSKFLNWSLSKTTLGKRTTMKCEDKI